MRTISRLVHIADWSVTLLVGYLLLQFGADRVSRLVASRYVTGNYSEIDTWMTVLGFCALVSIFFLVHPRTRFHTATTLTIVLGGDSLRSLSLGDPQAFSIPMLSLASATLVLLSSKPSRRGAKAATDGSELIDLGLTENRA